jgi:hypothetical protein
VEVKIGVTDSPRELIFNSAQTPSEVEKLITDALSKDSGVLSSDRREGPPFLVQSAKIAYVEIGAADVRRVGFGRRRGGRLRPGKRHVGQAAPDELHRALHGVVLGDRPVVVQPVPG